MPTAPSHQNLDYYRIGTGKNFGGGRGGLLVAQFVNSENRLAQESSHTTGSVPSDLRRFVSALELEFDGYGTSCDGFELQNGSS